MTRRNRSQSPQRRPAASPGGHAPAGGDGSASPTVDSPGRSAANLAATVLIVLAAVAVYSNSLHCPFIFDDLNDIVNNASIRHLWPIHDVFIVQYEGWSGLHSRPVVNFSLAVNYAIGGLQPFAYHVTNLLVHVLAGLTLFGIVRRTLLLPSLGGRFSATATSLAAAVALIWTLHPLQTGAVTYITQRYESMMGLFYLLALYAAVRCGTSTPAGGWAVVAVGAMLLALGCKEVAVSIPIAVLLYDRAFLAGSFREAWRRRWAMYLGLVAVWACFAVLLLCSSGRGKWAGYALPVTWMQYAQSQFGVILHYLRLTVWPRPLVLDYAWPVALTLGDILPGAAVIGGLAAATAWALIRWPKCGFLGAWFFLILAPTSSVLPIRDLAFEHRMYLPLAAVVAGAVIGGYVLGQRIVAQGRIGLSAMEMVGGALVLSTGVAFGVLTFDRNADYRTALSIWADTVAKAPHNVRAHYSLGAVLAISGRVDDAIAQYEQALQIDPGNAKTHNNFGLALQGRGQLKEALVHFRKAVEANPKYVDAHVNLGATLLGLGQVEAAIAEYRIALELDPNNAKGHSNLGVALDRDGQMEEAITHCQKAVEISPETAEVHYNFGNALARRGRIDEAMIQFEQALQIRPDHAETHNNLGIALAGRGRIAEAIPHFRRAVELKPDFVEARKNLAMALGQDGNAR